MRKGQERTDIARARWAIEGVHRGCWNLNYRDFTGISGQLEQDEVWSGSS